MITLRKVEFVKSATNPSHYPDADRPEIAFAGRSNVGKSSLLNTVLARRKIARVSRTPGRTQLINFFNVNDRIYFVDLPGYGYAKVPKEVQRKWGPMMESYVRSRPTLCLMFVLLDVRHNPTAQDRQLFEALEAMDLAAVPVLTKCDKLSKSQRFKRLNEIAKSISYPARALIQFSSVTKAGRDEIWRVTSEATGYSDEELSALWKDEGTDSGDS